MLPSVSACCRLGITALLLVLLVGCTTHVIPPAHPVDPVTVYLTDYGRHSSLLLPDPRGGFDEYAFGDWEFFALGDTRWWVAVRAILHSPQATLGRRHVEVDPQKLQIKAAGPPERTLPFEAPRAKVDALAAELDARFRRDGDSPLFSSYSKLYHVRDPGNYWGLHNCNHVTAEWLRELGCCTEGPAIFSKFVITEKH